jgi:hypothetical protein
LPAFKVHLIIGVKGTEIVVVFPFFPEKGEVMPEHFRHEVPGRSHVKGKSVFFPISGSSPKLGILLDQGHIPAVTGQEGRWAEATEASAYDYCFLVLGKILCGLIEKSKKKL